VQAPCIPTDIRIDVRERGQGDSRLQAAVAVVPVISLTVSQRRRDAKPQLVTLEVFPKALHAESWNVDRVRYTSVVKSFLAPFPR
jgi:hypothetical protein